jgi:hypothetical protein
MPMTDGQDMQLDIFNVETPTEDLPRMNCTNSEGCTAQADEHVEGCPVERDLRDTFGF